MCIYLSGRNTKIFQKKVKKGKLVLKFFLHDYIKINLAMDNKDGNFNSIPFQCKKVDGIINVLLTEKIRKD